MKCTTTHIALLLSFAVISMGSPAWADKTIEDFEKYKKNEEHIGTSWDSKPWARFGEATLDNVIVTRVKSKVISGAVSAVYSVGWPNTFGCALRALDDVTDVSEYGGISFKVKSNEPATLSSVKLAITDGSTTFLSREAVALTDKTQKAEFTLSQDDMELVDGSGSYNDVVAKISHVGFQVYSKATRDNPYFETISFDDLSFTSRSSAKAE